MYHLKNMKEKLVNCVESQLGDLYSADSKELGEAIDMIKDLSEAIYYCSIVEAMEHSEEGKNGNGETHIHHYSNPMMRDGDRMYYPYEYNIDYNKMYYPPVYYNMDRGNGSTRNYPEHPIMIKDPREGRAGESRRNYMESKEMHKDKAVKMQELEKYMHELSGDLTEMIEGATPEEKQIMKNKLTTLAGKIV